MIVDFLKQWGILHWEIAQTPYHLITLLPGTPSASHPTAQTSYQPVTLLPRHPISLSPYCLDTLSQLHLSHSQPISHLTHTLSHSHPISSHLAQTPYHHVTLLPGTPSACHPVTPDTLLPGHPISLTHYLTLTLSHTLSHSDPISLSPYLTHTLISVSPSLTLALSHSHQSHCHLISLTPYLALTCAQEVTEGMLELERSRIERPHSWSNSRTRRTTCRSI